MACYDFMRGVLRLSSLTDSCGSPWANSWALVGRPTRQAALETSLETNAAHCARGSWSGRRPLRDITNI